MSFGISPSEVVRHPSSRAADLALFFFGVIAESCAELVGELVLWATVRLGTNKLSMQSRKAQTILPATLLQEVTIVIKIYLC